MLLEDKSSSRQTFSCIRIRVPSVRKCTGPSCTDFETHLPGAIIYTHSGVSISSTGTINRSGCLPDRVFRRIAAEHLQPTCSGVSSVTIWSEPPLRSSNSIGLRLTSTTRLDSCSQSGLMMGRHSIMSRLHPLCLYNDALCSCPPSEAHPLVIDSCPQQLG